MDVDGQSRLSVLWLRVSAYDDSVHVFYGRQLWRLTDYGLDSPSYPVDIRTVYDHAPRTVDAAVYSRRTHQTYLFRGRLHYTSNITPL